MPVAVCLVMKRLSLVGECSVLNPEKTGHCEENLGSKEANSPYPAGYLVARDRRLAREKYYLIVFHTLRHVTYRNMI